MTNQYAKFEKYPSFLWSWDNLLTRNFVRLRSVTSDGLRYPLPFTKINMVHWIIIAYPHSMYGKYSCSLLRDIVFSNFKVLPSGDLKQPLITKQAIGNFFLNMINLRTKFFEEVLRRYGRCLHMILAITEMYPMRKAKGIYSVTLASGCRCVCTCVHVYVFMHVCMYMAL